MIQSVPLSLIPTSLCFSGTAGSSEGNSGFSEGHWSAACCQRDHFACWAEATGRWQTSVWLCLARDAQPCDSEGNTDLPQHLSFLCFVFFCGAWGWVYERPLFPVGPDTQFCRELSYRKSWSLRLSDLCFGLLLRQLVPYLPVLIASEVAL